MWGLARGHIPHHHTGKPDGDLCGCFDLTHCYDRLICRQRCGTGRCVLDQCGGHVLAGRQYRVALVGRCTDVPARRLGYTCHVTVTGVRASKERSTQMGGPLLASVHHHFRYCSNSVRTSRQIAPVFASEKDQHMIPHLVSAIALGVVFAAAATLSGQSWLVVCLAYECGGLIGLFASATMRVFRMM